MKKVISLTIVLLLTLFLFVNNPAYAEDGNVGGKPANPRKDNPRSESIFVHELNPGQSVADAVLITNESDDTKQVKIYATDAQISSGGAFACEQEAESVDSTGAYITMNQNEIELKGKEERKIGFTIDLPQNASAGEQNACIAIQSVEAPVDSDVNGVQLSFRSAIRVAITVTGNNKKELDLLNVNVKTKIDGLLVRERLSNKGNVSLDVKLSTKLNSFAGTALQTKGGEFPVLPSQEAEFNFEFKRPPWGGFYRITAEARYDENTKNALGAGNPKYKTISMSKWVFIAPTAPFIALYLLTALLIIGIGTFLLRRRKRQKFLKENSVKYTVVAGDDITTIAEKNSLKWKELASLNGLKKPYTVQAGQELLVPQITNDTDDAEEK